MVPFGESGALYRTEIVADAQLTVTVDLVAHRGAVVRAVHRASCSLPSDTGSGDEPIRRLMGAADKAAWTVLNSREAVPPSAGTSRRKGAAVEPALDGPW